MWHGHGGIAGLIRLIREHAGAVEADLCRYYPGVDLAAVCDGRVSLRKFAALVKHLPIESASATTQGGSGFSMLELLVMETGVAGPLNPRHPWNEVERQRESDKARALRERRAYYDEQRRAQSLGAGTPSEEPSDRPEQDG